MASSTMELKNRKVVSDAEWLAARKELLAKEKIFTKLRDELSRDRRELPWEGARKPYVFDGPNGKESLADLFAGRSQLLVYHFMMGPGWKEGCPSCSLIGDHFDGLTTHLANRDVTLAVVSRATYPEIEAFKKRMGWKFKWVSSNGNDFNYDYHVSFTKDQQAKGEVYYNYQMTQFPSEEAPGLSVFSTDGRAIFHTYSTYGRGLDILLGVYNFLDMAPKGRDEDALAWPMAWVRHHDQYDHGYVVDPNSTYVHPEVSDEKCCSDVS
jgi:predicted dithiol-disulfide oxidoreductase (DUF899 family)